MSAPEPLQIRAFDEQGLAQLNHTLQTLFQLGVLRIDVKTNDGGRLIVGNFGGPNSPAYGMQVTSGDGKKLIEADGEGFRVYDTNGNIVDSLDATGLNIYGQGLALLTTLGVIQGYLGYGIGGGNAVVLSSIEGAGVTLLAGLGADRIALLGGRVVIPAASSDPADAGEAAEFWYRTDLNELRFWSNGAKRKIATVAA